MKIAKLCVSNFLGAAAVDVGTDEPITLFCGRNGSGKSSLRDAVALALSADLGRVSLKKDAPQLIREGADGATCEVVDADGDVFCVSISAGGSMAHQRPAGGVSPTLPYVLDAQRFARLDATERRAFLFGLMGVKMDQGEIARRLEARGCHIGKVQRILPLLRSGFDAASKQAKASATEAKGAWRAVAGEAYGSEKAKTWKAAVPPYDAAAARALATEIKHADVALEQWQQQVGKLQAELERRSALEARLPALREAAGKIDRIQTKLLVDEQSLAGWEADLEKTKAAAGATPRVGLVHDLARALRETLFFVADSHEFLPAWEALLSTYEAEHGSLTTAAGGGDANARARLPSVQSSRNLLAKSVANDRRDLLAAQQAKAALDELTAELTAEFDVDGLANARAEVDKLKAARAEAVRKSDQLRSIKAQVDAADQKTKEAAEHAADVASWDAIGNALAPDGIPAELLAEALGPINERLLQSAEDTGWPQVVVHDDMRITAALRAYGFLSESERWRVDAMIAESIAHLSGERLLLLDRFDVLDLQGRQQLLGWMHALAETGEIDSALLFGTLKAAPTGLPQTIGVHWIENGVVAQLREAA